MNIGLIDVDSHNFPNLALMKISAFHKSRGDHVEWWWGFGDYDIVYMSKVFDDTYSKDVDEPLNARKIIKGGTGYGLNGNLPEEIEHIYPDYSLYGAVFCPEQKQGRKHGGRYRVRNHTETGLLKGGKHMNEIILKRIGALLSVKSIVTLALTAVFAYLAVTKQISQEFMVVYTVVIAFYFGTQTQKISDAVESKGAQ